MVQALNLSLLRKILLFAKTKVGAQPARISIVVGPLPTLLKLTEPKIYLIFPDLSSVS
jgi:hypothetical protein